MKQIIALIVVTTIVAFCISSCKKDHTDTPAPFELQFSAEALAYVQLPLNKYFIYKDSATGTLDSVVVTESNIVKQFIPEHKSAGLLDPDRSAFYYQTFTLKLTKYIGGIPQDWFDGNATNLTFTVTSSNPATPLTLGNNIGGAFRYPITISSNPYQEVNILPSVTIEGKTYLNVAFFSDAIGLDITQPSYHKSTYYWVKGIGIIKREIRTSTSIKTEMLVRNG